MTTAANPVLVEVTRGEMVESVHRGAAAVVNAECGPVAQFGDIRRPIYPRSAIKPLQALALVESGALERYQLDERHIALACASHSGQTMHVEMVRKWLAILGLDESNLECGAHEPAHIDTHKELIRQNISPSPAFNNCSGKHTGFLTVACHRNEPVEGYTQQAHPVQQTVIQILEELTDEPLNDRPSGLDGCGIPVTGISLYGIAQAFARMAASNFDSDSRRTATERIKSAMSSYPELVGGEYRFCTHIPKATQNHVLVKVGAEGVYAGMALGDEKLGFALKIDDGSRRAAEVAMGWLISSYCGLGNAQLHNLKPWFEPEISTVAKKHAGIIRPALQ